MSERVALLIGNSAYPNGSVLKNPTNDARDLAKQLRRFGFTVSTVTDGTKLQMESALETFEKRLKTAKVRLMFFAGHGFQSKGENYLVAVDAKASSETQARNSSLSLKLVIETMENTNTATNIIILDACRDNPFDRTWTRLLTSMQWSLRPYMPACKWPQVLYKPETRSNGNVGLA